MHRMMKRATVALPLLYASAVAAAGVASTAAGDNHVKCANHTLPNPAVFGASIVALTAERVINYEGIAGNDVCFVNVTLTHTGGDRVNNYIALPLTGWNGVFQGIGGNGFAAGNLGKMANQTVLGYATGTTDAGHNISTALEDSASAWALTSLGNVNHDQMLNFVRRSLHDMTVVGKSIVESFYGCPAHHSYWNGCSTGGRQGLAIAQYYPTDYDGIIANAPAIQWNDMTPAQFWPYTVQISENYTLQPCELEAAVNASIKACDGLDGLLDGQIDAPALCHFSAHSLVGRKFTCVNGGDNLGPLPGIPNVSTFVFSQKAAEVIDKIWQGPRTPQGEWMWYGFPRGANLTSVVPNLAGNSTPTPNGIPASFFQNFIAKDLNYNVSGIGYENYTQIVLQSHLEWESTFGDASPDLRAFKRHGGKMITWQGLADNLIPPQGSMLYYQKVRALDPAVHDFYRQFFSPGVGHCGNGTGVMPIDTVGQLRAWVENGTAPATLQASSPYPANVSAGYPISGAPQRSLGLCPWPSVAKYKGRGDAALAASWHCVQDSGWLNFTGGPSGASFAKCSGPAGWY